MGWCCVSKGHGIYFPHLLSEFRPHAHFPLTKCQKATVFLPWALQKRELALTRLDLRATTESEISRTSPMVYLVTFWPCCGCWGLLLDNPHLLLLPYDQLGWRVFHQCLVKSKPKFKNNRFKNFGKLTYEGNQLTSQEEILNMHSQVHLHRDQFPSIDKQVIHVSSNGERQSYNVLT